VTERVLAPTMSSESSSSASAGIAFDKGPSLRYLGLPQDYLPSPEDDPIGFLSKHVAQLPPHILAHYSYITTPKQRTPIVAIRNRRLRYANGNPPELLFESARNSWPDLWQGRERRGVEEGNDERLWAQQRFLDGDRQHIGKLGSLLADYEEEREAERVRNIRRSRVRVQDDFVPEEDSDSDEGVPTDPPPQESDEDTREWFERRIRERFIYGLLDVGDELRLILSIIFIGNVQNIDYDQVDWNESLSADDDRDAEERWFDDDDGEETG